MAELQINQITQKSDCYQKAVEIDKKGNSNGVIDGREIVLFDKAILETYFLEDGCSKTHGIKTGNVEAGSNGESLPEILTLSVSKSDLDKYLIFDNSLEGTLNNVKGSLKERESNSGREFAKIMGYWAGGTATLIGLASIVAAPLAAGLAIVGGVAAIGGTYVLSKYLENRESEKLEQEIDQLLAKNEEIKNKEMQKIEESANAFAESTLMGKKVGKDIGKMIAQEGFENLEVANISEDINHLFMTKNGKDIEVKFTKTDDRTFAGMISASSGSESKLYIFKAEYIETGKSKKLKLSKMRVVQDSIDDNSAIHKKLLKETVETQRTQKSHSESQSFDTSLDLGFFKIKLGMDSKASSNDYREFERIVTEQLPEGKEVTIYSIDK